LTHQTLTSGQFNPRTKPETATDVGRGRMSTKPRPRERNIRNAASDNPATLGPVMQKQPDASFAIHRRKAPKHRH
jgi:hypothetical protein